MTNLHLPSSLSALYPKLDVSALEHALNVFGLTDITVAQAFIAQCAHESGGFARFTENLNYSAEGLARTWKRFRNADGSPNEMAKSIARNPHAIANAVYNGRMGNRPDSDDGWNYRGRGAIQITGRANYEAVAKVMAQYGVVESPEVVMGSPDSLAEYPACLYSACAFWVMNNLTRYVGDFTTLTRKINGGTVGLNDRKKQLAKVKACFADLEKF